MTGISNTNSILKTSSLSHETYQSRTRDIISSKFIEFYPKVNQVIYFSAQNSMHNIKSHSSYNSLDISYTKLCLNIQKRSITPQLHIHQKRKENTGQIIFISNLYMVFQSPSIYTLSVMRHTQSVMNEVQAKSNIPLNFFKIGGKIIGTD